MLDGGPWTTSDILFIVQPGSGYTAVGFWDGDYNFNSWKINIEEQMRRSPFGFDYMDQLLDIVVSAYRSTWYWKDEDEVQQAQKLGLFTIEQVSKLYVYDIGNRAVHTLLANELPFNSNWEDWKPDPTWRKPLELPQGWEK